MGTARIGIIGVLALAPGLFGCAEDVPSESPLSPAPAACQQQARTLGFTVLGTGPLEPQPDGPAAYPILVQWGNDGAVHLRCRTDGGGNVTIG